MGQCCWALEHQPNADYHARREALAKKTNGNVVVLFAPMEAEGPNAIFGFHQDENFYYLSGWPDPGAALLIAPAVEATRSEEHTSELQSRLHLVCRLLLEKKKTRLLGI